jgi:hypothetical protein
VEDDVPSRAGRQPFAGRTVILPGWDDNACPMISWGRRYGFPWRTILCRTPARLCGWGFQARAPPVSLPRRDDMHLAVAAARVSLFPSRTIWGPLVANPSRRGRYWQRYSPQGPVPTAPGKVHIVRPRKDVGILSSAEGRILAARAGFRAIPKRIAALMTHPSRPVGFSALP